LEFADDPEAATTPCLTRAEVGGHDNNRAPTN
jgi:hypothetical protein